jgi:acetoacetyl-CoA synthetase
MGKSTSTIDKVSELAGALPTVEKVVVISSSGKEFDETEWPSTMRDKVIGWADFLDGGDADPVFTRVPFSHPQFVLYSSGTTGMPKSIAHGCGNTLLQHGKELVLHGDLREGDKMLFYTTCGWMMWNWMASSLFAGAAIVCFDGFAARDPVFLNLNLIWWRRWRRRGRQTVSFRAGLSQARRALVPRRAGGRHALGHVAALLPGV